MRHLDNQCIFESFESNLKCFHKKHHLFSKTILLTTLVRKSKQQGFHVAILLINISKIFNDFPQTIKNITVKKIKSINELCSKWKIVQNFTIIEVNNCLCYTSSVRFAKS